MKLIKYIILVFTLQLFSSFLIVALKQEHDAEFRVTKNIIYDIDDNTEYFNYKGMALLYDSPSAAVSTWKGINDGVVQLNNKPLYYEPLIKFYVDSTERKTNQGITWSLNGSSTLSNFTYTCASTFPTFNSIVLPKIINKSQNLTFDFNTLSGADEIEITIDDRKVHQTYPWYTRTKNTHHIIIASIRLNDLSGNFVNLRVSFIKNEEKIISNKSFLFEHRVTITKTIPLQE